MAYLNYIHDMVPTDFPYFSNLPSCRQAAPQSGRPRNMPCRPWPRYRVSQCWHLWRMCSAHARGESRVWRLDSLNANFLWWNPLFILCFLIGHIECFSCLCNVRWGVAISHKTSFKGSQGELNRLMQRQPTMLELHYQLKQHFRLFWCNVNTGLINPPPPL